MNHAQNQSSPLPKQSVECNAVRSAVRTNQTQRELVRLLVLEHGLQKASELSGVPYDLVRQWESRRQRKEKQIVTSVTNPVQVVAERVESELAENERETRLSLARSAAYLAKKSERTTLRNSNNVKNVAQTAAIVHRWDTKQVQANVMVNIALLGVDPTEVQCKALTVEPDLPA